MALTLERHCNYGIFTVAAIVNRDCKILYSIFVTSADHCKFFFKCRDLFSRVFSACDPDKVCIINILSSIYFIVLIVIISR